MSIANIALRAGCRVTEIVPSHEAAHGVRFDAGSGQSETLAADLIVDASGRGALTLALLDILGWERPHVSEVGVDITYATAVVQIPAGATPDWKVALTQPHPPAVALNAVLLPLESGRWIVTIVDRGSDLRPDSWDSFHAMFSRLITPTIYGALRHAKPLEGIRHYGLRASHWRHFERLPGLPRGVLPIGDALCRFNPIHAQGMSAAAKQARLLQTVLGQMADDRIRLRRRRPVSWPESNLCSRRPGACPRVLTSLFPRRAANDRRTSRKFDSSRPIFSVQLSPIPSYIA